MLQDLMRPSPKGKGQLSPKRQTSPKKIQTIQEIRELESEIIANKPNNIVQFIRDWANSKLSSFTLTAKNHYIESDNQQQYEPLFLTKKERANKVRRFAVICLDKEVEHNQEKYKIIEKLQQTKSMILIKLRKMDLFKTLTNQNLWCIVEQFQQRQFQSDEIILQRNKPTQMFSIVISGIVIKKLLNKKPIFLPQGSEFGQDSLLFSLPSFCDYISQGISRVAMIEGNKISKIIRQYNIQRYKIFTKAINNIEFLKTLHQDQVDKIVEIALNQNQIPTQIGQQINLMHHSTSFFIIVKGLFHEYQRKITEQLRKSPNREYHPGDAFNYECLFQQKSNNVIISQNYGYVVEVRCSDVEKIIGPLSKLSKRKKRRMQNR